jgi:hypothetical protein
MPPWWGSGGGLVQGRVVAGQALGNKLREPVRPVTWRFEPDTPGGPYRERCHVLRPLSGFQTHWGRIPFRRHHIALDAAAYSAILTTLG